MLILILETSSEKSLIALAKEDTVLREKKLKGGKELSDSLAEEVSLLLNGEKPSLIAVGTGPGSYTGVRAGLALAKGLKIGFNAPIFGFCSLESFGPAPVLVDAKSGGFYALFDEEPIRIDKEHPLVQNLEKVGSPHPEQIKKILLGKTVFEERFPNANRLAKLIWDRFQHGKTAQITPNYLASP